MIGENYGVTRQAFTGYLKYLPGTADPRRAIFASTQQNPGLPSSPGQPGTLIVSRGDILKITEPTSIFVSAVGQTWWLYVGDYMLNIDHPLSPVEWQSLPEKVLYGSHTYLRFDAHSPEIDTIELGDCADRL